MKSLNEEFHERLKFQVKCKLYDCITRDVRYPYNNEGGFAWRQLHELEASLGDELDLLMRELGITGSRAAR